MYKVCVALILILSAFAIGHGASALFVIEDHGKYGFMDSQGSVVIEHQFTMAFGFKDDLARVCVGGEYLRPLFANSYCSRGKWGFINDKGIFVINPRFGDAKDFNNGLAAVKINFDDDQWVYIDKKGQIINPLSGPRIQESDGTGL